MVAGNLRRRDHLAADFGDRRGQFLGARRYRLHVDRGFLGGGGYRVHQRTGLVGGRRHALRRGLHGIGRFLQAVQRGADGCLEFGNPGFHAGGAFGLADAVPVLIGGERTGLDHALAENLQRIRHRRDLVALARAIDFRLEVTVRQKLHRALQTADPAQDAAADIEPDEQHGSDQGEAAERKHDRGRERDLLAGLPGRGIGLALHAADQLLDADAKTDIELAGFIEHELAVIVGVQFLLAKFKDAGVALAQRQQFQRCVLERPGRGVLRQQIEIRLDARLRDLEFLFDGFERLAAVYRERGGHLGCHQVAAGDGVAELVDGPRHLGCIILGKHGRVEDGVDLDLGVQHRRVGGGNEGRLRAAQRVVLLLMLRGDLQPIAGGRDQALDVIVDIPHGFGERGDHRSVGAEFDHLAELIEGDRLGFLHFFGAFVQRLLAARGQ